MWRKKCKYQECCQQYEQEQESGKGCQFQWMFQKTSAGIKDQKDTDGKDGNVNREKSFADDAGISVETDRNKGKSAEKSQYAGCKQILRGRTIFFVFPEKIQKGREKEELHMFPGRFVDCTEQTCHRCFPQP